VFLYDEMKHAIGYFLLAQSVSTRPYPEKQSPLTVDADFVYGVIFAIHY
jgi:hypothetical protein